MKVEVNRFYEEESRTNLTDSENKPHSERPHSEDESGKNMEIFYH